MAPGIHTEIHAAFENISVQQTARHATVETFTAWLVTGVAYRVFAHGALQRNPKLVTGAKLKRLLKESERVIEAAIRTYHKDAVESWHALELTAARSMPKTAAPPPVPSGSGWPFDTVPGGGSSQDNGASHMHELHAHVMSRQQTITSTGELPTGRKRLWSKAFLITIPISLVFLIPISETTGAQTQIIPLWERMIPGVLVALLGSPRLRWRALGTLVVVVLIWLCLGAPT